LFKFEDILMKTLLRVIGSKPVARASPFLLFVLCMLIAGSVSAGPDDLGGETLLLKYWCNASGGTPGACKDLSALHTSIGSFVVDEISLSSDSAVQVVRLPAGVSPEDAISRYTRISCVAYAEPDSRVTLDLVPNDPRFKSDQWGARRVSAPGAWSLTTGRSGVKVAVIDTGVDYLHPDLKGSLWTNPGECGRDLRGRDKRSNGVDDDQNGLVDDWRGWNFSGDDNDPYDEHGHGTFCAGILGARGNNGIGIAGMVWRGTILPIKAFDADGTAAISTLIRSFHYADRMGARVISCSWGTKSFSRALQDVIGATRAVVVCSAGNEGVNTDVVPHYPSGFSSSNIIAVAATDPSDSLATFSNYGRKTIDIGAPGVEVISTTRGGTYAWGSGTSVAVPYASGAAALVLSRYPTLQYDQVITQVLMSVDQVRALNGKLKTEGRLNARSAVVKNPYPGPMSTPTFA
jgi:subtilisin family serine protease